MNTPANLRRRGNGRWLMCLAALCSNTALAAPDKGPVAIGARPLAELAIHPQTSAPATAISANDSRLSTQVTGKVLTIPAQVGTTLAKGTPLVTLDCRDHELTLTQAQARRDFAARQLERAKTLSSASHLSEEQLDQRQTEFTEADAALQQAKLAVERCVVRAPFEGVVLARLIAEGELANPGTPVIHLLDTGRGEVSAQIPLEQVEDLRAAQQVWFAQGTNPFPVRLRDVAQAINTTARNREARLQFTGPRPLPGTPGRLVWQAARPHIPADLLVRRNGILGVLTVNDHKARFVPVPGALEGQPAPTDLPPHTRLIIEGRFALNDGDPVATTEP